jgi:hypothetical protein
MIGESNQISNQIDDQVEEPLLVAVKSLPFWKCVEKSQTENAIENLIDLRHPCIAAPIHFVIPIESDSAQELKIASLYSDGCSLTEVLSVNPVWWTSTVKVKVSLL